MLFRSEDVEIIVVNDGSSDGTSEVAKKYEEKYPGIVKAVDKENGGHGDAVNTGLAHATGVYFKVVDSDDWVDADSKVDMLISNYVYEKVGMTHTKVIHYRNVLPQNQVFRWDDIGSFHLDQYILMHSVIYRTERIRQNAQYSFRLWATLFLPAGYRRNPPSGQLLTNLHTFKSRFNDGFCRH